MIIPLTSLICRVRSRSTLTFHHQNRCIVVNGRKSVLQEKTWQVMRLLQQRSPEIVSRREIIEQVWGGNWFTGEKGLNQTIWNLRKALDDDAHAPSHIRTMPRIGYQWIYPARQASQQTENKGRMAFVLTLFFIGLSGITFMAIDRLEAVGELPQAPIDQPPASTTYLSDNEIVISFETGCQSLIRPSAGKVFGQPVLSENGYHVAFTVYEAASCKTVTWSIANERFEEFDFCPAPAEPANPTLVI